MTVIIYDSFEDEIGRAESVESVVAGDGLGRTAKKMADDNDGYIVSETADGVHAMVYDSVDPGGHAW